MRVYSSSPLYNYVELIFRSKRLFIVSIILATLATTGFYLSRTKVYTARMIVVLTGSELVNARNEAERGTIEYKIAILNVLLRDPNFFKQAMRDGGLNQGKSELEFAEFCKKASESLTYASDKTNILEIRCTWPSQDCDKIIKSFYSAYNRSVIDQETVVSTSRTNMLKVVLAEYANKHHELDLKVRDYQVHHARKPIEDFVAANNEYLRLKQEVARIKDSLSSAQRQRASIADKLSKTPKNFEDAVTYNGVAGSPEKVVALQARDAAKAELDTQLLHGTALNPKVKAAQEKYDATVAKLKALEDAANLKASQKPSPGDIISRKVNSNPQYQNLQSQLTDQDLGITRIQSDLNTAENQLKDVDQRLSITPDESLRFKAMTADMGLYSKLQDDLRAELEASRLNELRDRELKTKEMTVIVQPEAEVEKQGAKGALLLGAGPILGLIIAFCFSLMAESMDHALRTPTEVEKYLNKPVLAVLPRMDTNKRTGSGQLGSGDGNRPSLPR